MRYQFYHPDKDTELINILKVTPVTPQWFEVELETSSGSKTVQWRKVAGKNFISEDAIVWQETQATLDNGSFLNVDSTYQVFRGYRPSSFSSDAEGGLVTQMPGKIVKLLIKEGQEVKKGEPALVLEAMKMENEVKCNQDGKVTAIHVTEGQSVESGVLLVEIE